MQVGIDSFAAHIKTDKSVDSISRQQAMKHLLERITLADDVGLDLFGVGEHHREEFLDAAPSVILAAAAAKTKTIRLTSAVSVLSTADPVRLFQQFATLDLISNGRAEMIVGRGSFSEAFPLFGYDVNDYNDLFIEKLDLLLQCRDHTTVTWSGQFRPSLTNQSIFPRPLQQPLPVWVGVGGTPASFERAGRLGLPLMIAIIGGQVKRFKPLVDVYKQAWEHAGHNPGECKVGIHVLGYVEQNSQEAKETFFPGYQHIFSKIGQERGWGDITRDHFHRQTSPEGAFLVGSPEEVAEKMIQHSHELGGICRCTFQMNVAALPHDKLMQSIEMIGTHVAPLVKKALS